MKPQLIRVQSPSVTYGETEIRSKYSYAYEEVVNEGNVLSVLPKTMNIEFKTNTVIPKTGLLLIGWGGNNGSTVTGAHIANRDGIQWNTRNGLRAPNYFGSLTQASTLKLGRDKNGDDVYIPFNQILPMVHPNDLVIGGWDISKVLLFEFPP